MLTSYIHETGTLMTGTINSFNPKISGNTLPLVAAGVFSSSGYGQVYGFFFDPVNISFGLVPHNSSINSAPSPTGVIYYNSISNFGGSPVSLRFLVTAWSGYGGGVVLTGGLTDSGVFVGDPFVVSLNASGYSGLSHVSMPAGYPLHFESYQLLPNYGKSNPNALTGAYPYTVQVGGIYPSMLRDNILSINLQMVWSGACGDAHCCDSNPCP